MAGREQRVDDALQQLLFRLLPSDPEEDEAVEDQRYDDALQFARDTIGSEDRPEVADDVNHAADLIRRKLVRENDKPDKAARFSNLYSRLLSQPVLSQKWAILYFLYQLADSGRLDASAYEGTTGRPRAISAAEQGGLGLGHGHGQGTDAPLRDEQEAGEGAERGGATDLGGNHQRGYSVDSPAFNEAFSKNGLPRLPRQQDVDAPRPTSSWEREREREKPTGRARAATWRKNTTPSAEPDEPAVPEVPLPEPPSEAQLLRDLPFTLQGLSTTNLVFSDKASLELPVSLPIPLISLLHSLAEPSLLYRSLSEFVESSEGGLVGQSLRSAIGVELRAYLGLVATLEGQIRRALTQVAEQPGRQGLGKAGVTLKRCVVWIREATMGLRLMSMIVEGSKGKKGGQLISLIHSYSSSHGDPFVIKFAERLLAHVTKPFYSMLQHWIYDGELEDPFYEFFVSENADLDNDPRRTATGAATSVWEDKYRLKDSMIPSIITPDFAKKIFLIGKSLNFIRYGCGDSVWVENHSRDSTMQLRYGDTATLESSIDSAYKRTTERLIHLMDHKFKLFEHLSALKKYLLLGQGDFIALLMESLSSNLDRPANSQYRHTLTAQLEHAIRNSNAQYDSAEVLRRLDARMLELSHGEIGWDVFTLEYRVDSPLDVIVTPWASKQYLKVFNFLWRVKRVEFALGSTWRRCMTGARSVLAAVSDKLDGDWQKARGGIAEMIHFVSQLQHYILFEVIEAGWEGLLRALHDPNATLDTLITAHTSYLRSITRKGLLASSSSSSSGPSTTTTGTTSSAQQPDFTSQLHELLKLMLAYKDAVDSLYSFSVAEFTRRQEVAAKIETRTAAGGWGLGEKDDLHSDNDHSSSSDDGEAGGAQQGTRKHHHHHHRRRRPRTDTESEPNLPDLLRNGASSSSFSSSSANNEAALLSSLRERLAQLGKEFRARTNVLLGDLAWQSDVDMRFLGVVMNFNDVYRPVRRRRGVGGQAWTGSGGGAGAGVSARSGERTERAGERGERARGKGRERERNAAAAAANAAPEAKAG